MHMWVIYAGRHLSRTLKNFYVPAEDRTGDLSILRRAFYHVAIKAGLYRKAVQVYYIPNQYPVTSTNNKNKTQTKSKAGSWIEGQVATMLKLHTRQIDKTDTTMQRANKRTSERRQNRIAALGRPAMKLLGGFN